MRFRKPPPTLLVEAGRVERAATALSPLEREVLTLSAGRGMRNAEIAERLGISELRAERILGRALRKFDAALESGRRPRCRLW